MDYPVGGEIRRWLDAQDNPCNDRSSGINGERCVMDANIVTSDPEILGGTPVFVGTRVPVSVLFENLADGLTLDEILGAYPTLFREKAIAALQQAESLIEIKKVS